MPRKKKEAQAVEPQPFTVGEADDAPAEEERPKLSDETVGGLLDLRQNLTRVPSGLLWPLQTLPSMAQHLSDLGSAGEAVDKLAVRHAMSSDKLAELRRFLLSDAYSFTYLVCRHRDIVPEVHMAMCYASAGQAGKLAWLITQSGFEGYVIDHFRQACAARAIDPRTIDGVYALDRALDWQNQRWPRGWYKSSAITHGGTVIEATQDPNRSILIVCAKEDKANQLVEQSGKTIQSGTYADIFPDRVPKAARDISKTEVTVAGRTVSSREKTIQGTSYVTREISGHYGTIRTDDIVIRDVRGGIVGGGEGGPAIRWLHGMRGMRILAQRWRRIHVGTINSFDDDDHAWLSYGRRASRVMSIVIPAEIYEGGVYPDSVYTRGTPTAPTFFDEKAILEALDETVADESEADGVEAFRSDFWLAPSKNATRLFTEDVVNDPDRAWMGPYEHPDRKLREREPHRFMLARFKRNDDGQLLDRNGKTLDVKADGWRKLVALETFDPWSDLDRIVTLNTTWASGGKRWALTVSGVDPQLTRFQLETRSGDGGANEWADALRDVAKLYKPRVIGLDRKAHADSVVQNMLKTDKRLLGLRSRVVGVDQQDTTEEARIRASLSEPLNSYRLMLLAISEDTTRDYGASITRKELLMFRAGSDKAWPILDSIAMTAALMRAVQTKEERHRIEQRAKEASARAQREYDPMIGGPRAA